MGISRLLYNMSVRAYHTGIMLFAPFNEKARKWEDGRKDWQAVLQVYLNDKPVIWVHCASLGEYEQGKPAIDALEAQYPQKQVVVSFYSPSGYEVVKRREPQRAIIYLPPDGDTNARVFLGLLRPELAIFIKYEFWYHYLHHLKQQGIPTLLVSGIFREGQPFFKPWGWLHREMLGFFEHFFVQDEASAKLLNTVGFKNVTISGDTRFDRVGAILANPQPLPKIEEFKAGSPVFIAGSTWPADEELLLPLLPEILAKGWKVIIAPHDIHTQHIQKLLKQLGEKAATYSTVGSNSNSNVLIIDSVGLLAHVYKYGELAYIGGGFGKGIHNVLEPAANGLPVIIGTNYAKFKEAIDLINLGGAFSIKSKEELQAQLNTLLADRQKAAATAGQYVKDHQGSTDKVMRYLLAVLR